MDFKNTIKKKLKSLTTKKENYDLDTFYEKEESIKVNSYWQLRKVQEQKIEEYDTIHLPTSTNKKDIQGLNLENQNRQINLRQIWIPFDYESKYLHKKSKECFIDLHHTNLKGNKVEENLAFVHNEELGTAYFWYNEDTFDEAYKANYPEYFLDAKAPKELKEKYYNPKIIDAESLERQTLTLKEYIKYYEILNGNYHQILERQTLTFKEYIKYYKYLRGKYLGNFKISEKERAEIAFIDYFGIETAKEKLEQLKHIPFSHKELLELLQNTDITKWENLLSEASELCRKRNKTTKKYIQ